MSSCNDEKYDVNTLILINNKTQHNLHFIFKTKDKSMPDSIYLQFRNRNDSVSSGDYIQYSYDSIFYNRDKLLSKSEFVDYISHIKLFYIYGRDTFNIKSEFYDGESFWSTKSESLLNGIMFARYYWNVEYTTTLTDTMFESNETNIFNKKVNQVTN